MKPKLQVRRLTVKLTELDKAVLRLLAEAGVMHTAEIAEQFGMTEDEAVDVMVRLQEAGLVHFTPDSPAC